MATTLVVRDVPGPVVVFDEPDTLLVMDHDYVVEVTVSPDTSHRVEICRM